LLGTESECYAPRFKNKQLTIHLKPSAPYDAAYAIVGELNRKAREHHWAIQGRGIYFVSDAPPWKKRRNWLLKSAEVFVSKSRGPDVAGALYCDWPAGRLYLKHAAVDDGVSWGK
jgi:hypothetical protein